MIAASPTDPNQDYIIAQMRNMLIYLQAKNDSCWCGPQIVYFDRGGNFRDGNERLVPVTTSIINRFYQMLTSRCYYKILEEKGRTCMPNRGYLLCKYYRIPYSDITGRK